ncbi:putative pentatricopeptide repeat-containing protein At1g16830 [Humulus lupulus]|uniref:putative pentatricopeptide repeat-containing protein At1g16830 n=1 Tax=Humulus lupulus TaxID=3486 RepID=UPI002B4058B0|nr:putative pentatricopeptide repeat-containing protein At1g16830 [Humulus lupulus]XP_062082546.1 putative pentatricopeptide repeat-containing protein At1g16830 [Humulus lupulus]XP_062082547.1 putative pentatricopeptide repeat-containing protein At1g16830 [Humulus lupulus]XP_062082548.1 putative pentatricopeptide repeat-containing protein At1g16830 [Humulus lupulus]XP_062082549.1 putative pentatricopeptide repeat-containing protein At1g16830 [Humulus lupulus]XP_062082550.1 putative pentatricop
MLLLPLSLRFNISSILGPPFAFNFPGKKMLWRYTWTLFFSAPKRIVSALLPFVSNRYLSSQKVCATYKTHKIFRENLDPDFPDGSKVTLSHCSVHSTLLNCSSDLIALSFFLWCAKKPNFFHDRVTIEHMVGVVSRLVERYKTVRRVVWELEKLGCLAKASTFLLLLRICWNGGMNNLVLEVFDEMFSYGFTPNTFARNAIIDVLFRTGHADLAIKAWREIEVPNFLTFNIALCNLCSLKELFLVTETFRAMLRMGFYLNLETYEMVLNCFCKMGKIVEAYQVLGLMIAFGVPVSVNIWSILIDGYCRLRRFDMAVELLGKMVEAGLSPTVVTYTCLIRGFLKSQMVNDALIILHLMESRGCTPDLVLCNVLIDCLTKLGRYDDAIDVFDDMLKREIAPDSYTFCSLLSPLYLSGRFSLVLKLVSGLVVEADQKLCNSLLSYLCKAGFSCLAIKLYDDMLDRGLNPDEYTLAALLSGLCRSRRIDQAINVYHWILMSYPIQDPHIHTIIVDGLIKARKFHRAIRAFRKVVEDGFPLDVISYTVAIHGLFRGGRTGEVCLLYDQMKEVGIAPNVYTYNIMLRGFCKQKDSIKVRWILEEMVAARIELNYGNFSRLCSFFCSSCHSNSVIGQLVKMKNLRLIPAKAIHILDRHVQVVKVDEDSNKVLEGYLDGNLLVDTSGSEDLSDVAALMA